MSDYEILEKIGRGKYSQIFLAVHLPSKRTVVLKILRSSKLMSSKAEVQARSGDSSNP